MFPTNPIKDPLWLPPPTTSTSTSFPTPSSSDPTSPTLHHVPSNTTTSSDQPPPKRKGTSSLLADLAKKFSRKRSAPTNPPPPQPKISAEEIWKATSQTIHPKAAKLGMNSFNFSAGGSRDTRKGKISERELSPGAVVLEKRDRSEEEESLVEESVRRNPPMRGSVKRADSPDSSGEESGEERGRGRVSGTSAYSDVARKRASGYAARRRSSSSSSHSSITTSSLKEQQQREISYGSAQIAHFKAAYPRQIDTRSSNFSEGNSVQSPVSSAGSSMQRNGSSIFDRSSSRWDSIATDVTTPDVTTPDVSERHSKSSLFGKEGRGSMMDGCAEGQFSEAIVEEPEELTLLMPETGSGAVDKTTSSAIVEDDSKGLTLLIPETGPASKDMKSSSTAEKPEALTLLIPAIKPASIAPTEEEEEDLSLTTLPQKHFLPTKQIYYAASLLPAPFVPSDLQSHQVRVRDFSSGTHEVHNAMDMVMYPCSPFPRTPRKSIFVEWEDGFFQPVSEERKEALLGVEKEAEGWEDTLRGLSISAVNGNTEFYKFGEGEKTSQRGLEAVEEEKGGGQHTSSWAFGHKRSLESDVLPGGDEILEDCGELPLVGQEREKGKAEEEKKEFKPGHRRSRAVSLGRPRPKTFYVMQQEEEKEAAATGSRMSGSYEMEDVELDEAVAEECRQSDERRSAGFGDVAEGLERIEEDVCT